MDYPKENINVFLFGGVLFTYKLFIYLYKVRVAP